MKEMEGRWDRAMALPPSRPAVSACSTLGKIIYGNSYFKKFVTRLGVEPLEQMLSGHSNSSPPFELFHHVEYLGRLMHHCMREMILSNKFEYETIEPAFPQIAEHLCFLFHRTIARIEYAESK